MLTSGLAHRGPVAPSELWSAWNWDPTIWFGLVAVVAAHHRGWRRRTSRDLWRRRAFLAGLGSLGVALLSPLDAASASLASAHMVQHLTITLVAAPLLVIAAPVPALIRGLPRPLRRGAGRWRRSSMGRSAACLSRDPIAMGALHVLTVWFWHIGAPYDAAVDVDALHAVEHLSFLLTALLSWSAMAATTRQGTTVLVLFGLSVQCSVLGALLTFAPEPLYASYATTTAPWNLSPLADQQLAGVIMWVPAGVVYLAAAIVVLISWINPPWPTGGSRRPRRPCTAPARDRRRGWVMPVGGGRRGPV